MIKREVKVLTKGMAGVGKHRMREKKEIGYA